jgi:hypothetical protein
MTLSVNFAFGELLFPNNKVFIIFEKSYTTGRNLTKRENFSPSQNECLTTL